MKKFFGDFILFLGILATLFVNFTYAHPGNTDSAGCHTCRTNCPSRGLSYGQYHCHGGSSSYTAPVRTCADIYGRNSISAGNGKCTCRVGYIWNSSQTSCILAATPTELCQKSFGWNSVSVGNGQCSCKVGYTWNNLGTSCILKQISTCGLNSSSSNGKCSCNYGYTWVDANDQNNLDCKRISTVTTTNSVDKYKSKICRPETATKGTDGYCYCKNGYKLSSTGLACVKK